MAAVVPGQIGKGGNFPTTRWVQGTCKLHAKSTLFCAQLSFPGRYLEEQAWREVVPSCGCNFQPMDGHGLCSQPQCPSGSPDEGTEVGVEEAGAGLSNPKPGLPTTSLSPSGLGLPGSWVYLFLVQRTHGEPVEAHCHAENVPFHVPSFPIRISPSQF